MKERVRIGEKEKAAELLKACEDFEHMTMFLKDVFVTDEYWEMINLFGEKEYKYFERIQDQHDAMMESVEKILKILTPREEEVMKLRYGFEDGQMRKWIEIARQLGISKERVRQLKVTAMKRLKQPAKKVDIVWAYKLLRKTINDLINRQKEFE